MSQAVITKAFADWKAQQAINNNPVTLDEFIFAFIPGLDVSKPVANTETTPAADKIVHRQAVSKAGVVNENSVVYSVTLGADVGNFDFNWIGLANKATGTLGMIIHAPTQSKIKNASGQQGNVLVRSMLMEYSGAAAATEITTPAETWQIDFTARLAAMDERQRLENIDLYGAASFFDTGYLVAKTGTQFYVTKGAGYLAGLRSVLAANQNITVSTKPVKVWLDVSWAGTLTSVWAVQSKITVAADLKDYVQNGEQHFVFALASIDANGLITDLRPKGTLNEQQASDALKKHEQSRNHPDATTAAKGFTQLSSATDSDSEEYAATPKAVKTVNDDLSNLQKSLGTASKADIQTSKDDTTAGRALINGGAIALRSTLAGTDKDVASFNDIPANAVSFGYDNAANGPGFTGSVLDFSGSNGRYRVQIAAQYGGNRLSFRTRNGDTGGDWNKWGEIYHTLNKPKAADVDAVSAANGGTFEKPVVFAQGLTAKGRVTWGDYSNAVGDNIYNGMVNVRDKSDKVRWAYGPYQNSWSIYSYTPDGTLLRNNLKIDYATGAAIFADAIQGSYSGSHTWRDQYGTAAPFFNKYATTGTSEYHPAIKQFAAITGYTSRAFSMGSLVANGVLSWHLHMIDSIGNEINHKWDTAGNYTAPGQIIPGNYSNFDTRYDAKYQAKGTYVSDFRRGSQATYKPSSNSISWNYEVPAGCVQTGMIVQDTGSNSADNIGGIYYRPLQKYVNGAWVTISG